MREVTAGRKTVWMAVGTGGSAAYDMLGYSCAYACARARDLAAAGT